MSNAFAIAARLGLPAPILADARDRISAEHASMEETLAAIAAAEQAQVAALEAAQAERASASDERELARTGVARARREAAELLADARRSADELVARAEREVADLRREMTRQRNLAGGRRGASVAAFDDLSRQAARARTETEVELPPDAEPAEAGPQPRIGLFGRSKTLGSTGRIVEISGRTGRVTIETEGARLVVPADDVEVVPEPISGPAPRDLEAEEMRRRAAQRVSPVSTCTASASRPPSSASPRISTTPCWPASTRSSSSTASGPARYGARCATPSPSIRASDRFGVGERTKAATERRSAEL